MLNNGYIDNLKTIQEMKNMVHFIQNNKTKNEEEKKKLKTLKDSLSSISEQYITQIPDCFKIKVTEDTVVKNGEIIKLKTNINESNLILGKDSKIIFDGYTTMDGCLILYPFTDENEEVGIYAKNITPENEIDKFCQYEFCDSDIKITRLSGNIKINKGSTIGLLIPKYKQLKKELKK